MAHTKRKRKHRGTQAGTVEARGRTGRRHQTTQTDARKISRDRGGRVNRLDRPPTWRSSLNRAAISAAVFAVAVVLLFGRSIAAAVTLGGMMVLLYWPMSYYTDRWLHRRRQRQKQAGSSR